MFLDALATSYILQAFEQHILLKQEYINHF